MFIVTSVKRLITLSLSRNYTRKQSVSVREGCTIKIDFFPKVSVLLRKGSETFSRGGTKKPVRHGPEYKGNADFTEVLCKTFPAYHYKPSQTFLQLELNHRQTFETERIFFLFFKKSPFFH